MSSANLLRIVIVISILISQYTYSSDFALHEDTAAAIITKVAVSSELESYKAARGFQTIGKVSLMEVTLKPIEVDNHLYQDDLNYEVVFAYKINGSVCRLFIPIKVKDAEVQRIDVGYSDGGCGE